MAQLSAMEWILDILLMVLLTATLFHAVRLERALGVLKRDRVALQELVASFDASTRAAENGIERLQAATEGPGRQIEKLIERGTTLRQELTFLVQRGEGLADRLDETVRTPRPGPAVSDGPVARSPYAAPPEPPQRRMRGEPATREAEPKVRSQAERDLLKALRMVR
jgi:Domain of unknown function (DUF6468)